MCAFFQMDTLNWHPHGECVGWLVATSILIIKLDYFYRIEMHHLLILMILYILLYIFFGFQFDYHPILYYSTAKNIYKPLNIHTHTHCVIIHIQKKLNFVDTLLIFVTLSFFYFFFSNLGYCIIYTNSKRARYLCSCIWKSIATLKTGGFRSNHWSIVQ